MGTALYRGISQPGSARLSKPCTGQGRCSGTVLGWAPAAAPRGLAVPTPGGRRGHGRGTGAAASSSRTGLTRAWRTERCRLWLRTGTQLRSP